MHAASGITCIHELLRRATLGPAAHDRRFSFGITLGVWETIDRDELAAIDYRLEALFQRANDENIPLASVKATWDLWHGDGIKKIVFSTTEHKQMYVCELDFCVKDGDQLVIEGFAVDIEFCAPPLVMHCGSRHYFKTTVSKEWLSLAFPQISEKLLVGETLGLDGYELSNYALAVPEALAVVVMPDDIVCD